MALQVKVGGVIVPVLVTSIMVDDVINATAQTTFTVVGTSVVSVSQDMLVIVTDTVTGNDLYTGFIDSVDEVKFPGATTYTWAVTCKDTRWLADKRYWTGPEFIGCSAGDIAAQLHNGVLASEGITAGYAMDFDNTSATLGAGVLTNCTAASGILTLAASGVTFTDTDSTTANFATGTLNNSIALNNSLTIKSYSAIKYQGSAAAQLGLNNNLYTYRKIWAGSYTLVANDEFYFDIWVSSSSPEIKMGADLLFTDGTFWSSYATDAQDQDGLLLNPFNDLKGWADDQWYQRKITVQANQAGKVVAGVYLVIAGVTAGQYTGYFKNIKVTASGGGTTRINAFTGSSMQSNVPASNNGYLNVSASVVTVHEAQGQRFTVAQSIAIVGIVRNSIIDWTEITPTQTASNNSNYQPQTIIDMSMDGGATYQLCTNHQPLPLITGMKTTGVSLIFRETLNCGGPSPELAPSFTRISYTIYSAAAATKTDFFDADATQAALATGVLTNCTSYVDGLKTTGSYRSWDNLDATSQNVNGSGMAVSGFYQKSYYLRSDPSTFASSQFAFAGTWTNFIAEFDIAADKLSGSETGLYYRTTSWTNIDNKYGYCAMITPAAVILRVSTNGGTAGQTLIATTPLNFSDATFYRVKVAVTGSTHKIFVNDVQYISITDSTWTGSGSVGFRWYNGNAGTRYSAYMNNFGIVGYESDFISVSTRVTVPIALSGIVLDSRIFWTVDTFSTSIFVVESTLDGGSTWQTCTNWQQIPLLVNGYNAAGKSIKFRFIMTNQAINLPAILHGYSAWIIGDYNATGTRVSPVLALDAAGTQIGSSDVSWVASQPVGTSVTVDSSLDNSTYTNVPVSGGPVNGLTVQGAQHTDDFLTNTAGNYTATYWTGGAAPAFSIDTALSRIRITSGSSGIVLWNTSQFPTCKDVYLETIVNQCDQGGLIWRYTDVNNLYYLTIADNSAGAVPNTISIRKRVGSADTQITAPTAIPQFIRGTYHTIKLTMTGTTITILWDGVQISSVIDASLAGPGQVGFRQNSGTESDYYSVGGRSLGQTAIGKTAYTKIHLSTSDPTLYPSVSQLVTAVRGTDLMTGVMVPLTDYQYKKTCGQIMDDITKLSGLTWKVAKSTKRLTMMDRKYNTAPWPLYSSDPQFQGVVVAPKVTRASPLYRNRQYVTGALSISAQNENKAGNGQTATWILAYPVDSITSIVYGGTVMQVGLLGMVTGMDFYYTPGSNIISADTTFPILSSDQSFTIVYNGRVPYTSMRESTTQQAALALIDSSTGIVEASEDCGGLPASVADTIAQARIDQFAILTRIMEYGTTRPGLQAGQLQSLFVPEHTLNDVDMLITEVKNNIQLNADGSLTYQYDVSVAEGPPLGTWQQLIQQALAV